MHCESRSTTLPLTLPDTHTRHYPFPFFVYLARLTRIRLLALVCAFVRLQIGLARKLLLARDIVALGQLANERPRAGVDALVTPQIRDLGKGFLAVEKGAYVARAALERCQCVPRERERMRRRKKANDVQHGERVLQPEH